MLQIRLLGEFRLAADSQPLDTVLKPRLQVLLAFLLLHRHTPQPRQRLAFSFWPDSSEGQAFTNLRKLVFQLRQALPLIDAFLTTETHCLGWRNDAPFQLDVAELEQALDQLDRLELPAVETVGRVVALYRGELLPGCYDDWILPPRRALHERVVRGLERALTGLVAQHEYLAGLRAAEHLVRLDPLHEAGYRHLMHLRALSGDRAGALRVYHECVSVLDRELEVPPAAETRALYQQLLKSEPAPAQVADPVPAQEQVQAPLVGRKAEWQALQQAWQVVSRRGPHMVTLWGEAGVGKTRLVEELLRWARLRSGTVAYARAYAAEGALAYAPLAEWLRSEAVSRAVADLPELWQTELARLRPELLTENPRLPPPTPMTEDWQRQRFHEALARAVLAAPKPLLVALDDLQWCDGETLAWLRYLLHFDPQAPLLVVGTVRSEAVDDQHPLHALRRQLQRADRWTALELPPLDPAETVALAGHLAAADVTAWAAQLYQETEGNALFVVETVRAGLIGRRRATEAASPGDLPPTVQAVIEARLALLSPSARQLVQLAAATGRAFTLDLLAAAGDAGEDALVRDLDELWRRRIVRGQGDGYDFSHDKLREVAYAELSPMRRRRAHRRIAQALEQRHAADPREVAGLLAAHWEHAGERGRAASCALVAGDYALATYAPQQAQQQYARALALSDDAAVQLDALLGLSRAHFALEDFATAIVHAEQALALTAEPVPATAVAPRRAKLLHLLAEAWFARYDVDRCESYARAALTAADTIHDHETLCQSLSLLGQVCSARGDPEPELDLIDRALAICRQTGNRWREGRTLADLGWLQALRGEFGDAVTAAEAALACLATTDDRAGLAFAWNVLGRSQGGRGHYTAAFAAFANSHAIAAAIDHKFLLAQVPNMRGWLWQQLGDYSQALQLDREGVSLAQAWSKTPAEISAAINVALDTLHLGDPEQALAQLDAMRARIEQEAMGFHAWRWRLRLLEGRGWCYLALGQPQRSLELAQAAVTLAQATWSRKYVAAGLALRGRALAALEQPEAATAALAQAIALADQIGYQPLRWQRRGDLAQLYQATGRVADAEACTGEALGIVQAIAADLTDAALRAAFLDTPAVRTLQAAVALQ